ncbi:MAG: hypothetical protein KIS92_12235 [Planctomycetota bacterium]|nr:hypothetical protein [Planctomycetota bacterium]
MSGPDDPHGDNSADRPSAEEPAWRVVALLNLYAALLAGVIWWMFVSNKSWPHGKRAAAGAGLALGAVAGFLMLRTVWQDHSSRRWLMIPALFVFIGVALVGAPYALLEFVRMLMKGHGVSPFM